MFIVFLFYFCIFYLLFFVFVQRGKLIVTGGILCRANPCVPILISVDIALEQYRTELCAVGNVHWRRLGDVLFRYDHLGFQPNRCQASVL